MRIEYSIKATMIDDEFPNIDNLIEELNRLKRGCQLFEKLVLEIGIYNLPHTETYGGKCPDLSIEIRNFFNFDDSE